MKLLAVLLLAAGLLAAPAPAAAAPCPCTIWPATAAPATPADPDTAAVELGVKFRSDTDGYVTGVRFWKSTANTGTHVGRLWSSTGTALATVTFTGESASGWQTATFANPVAISAGTTYVASYYAPNGRYATDEGTFATAGVDNAPLHALRDGQDGANGVYRYGTGGGFPAETWQSANYWVDVVFDTMATDTIAPTVTSRTPAPGAVAPATTTVSATFSEPVAGAVLTVAGVPGTTGYDPATLTATFTPSAPLAWSSAYTVTASGATDPAGNVMTPATWSFTTSAPPPPPPDQGPGGPILVVRPAAGFTPFLAEVLRTEGLNEFATADLSTVTAATLSQYDIVLLGRSVLSGAQATMFRTWVEGGGRLIAFRPDVQLTGLLGLTGPNNVSLDGHLQVDTAQPPGTGITGQAIQYHGAADRYGLNGARPIAMLSDGGGPAVTLREVGSNGGQAAAFTYDLAYSLVLTRQGNVNWDGQERDGVSPRRSDDLFYGGAGDSDWIDLTKVAVPQADEQQRLLANLIREMTRDRTPLPRFWYFPRSLKAVVVATGDDHATGGTAGRFDQYAANSPAGCSNDAWECARYTSYVFPATPLSNSQATAYQARGFEVALHVTTNCADYTATSIAGFYRTQLATWRAKYAGVPAPVTNRTHCIAWSDWSSQASTAAANGIRLDTNYYFWPGPWVADRPGFMTGSGMPMRFAATTGALIDVYQAATQMTDESGQTYPFTVDALLDRALGAEGYYGAFTANMHTDLATEHESDELLASAQERGVPVISARQLLTWLDGRNGSSYSDISWSGQSLSFTVHVGAGATGLTGMVPTAGPGGRGLTALDRAGTPVAYTRTTIKGVEYAMFPAAAGAYLASYGTTAAPARASAPRPVPAASDDASPVASDVSVTPWPDGTATVSWATNESAAATLLIGATPDALTTWPADLRGREHRAVVTDLEPDATYHYRIRSTDPAGNVTLWPPADRPPASFTASALGVADHSVAGQGAGRPYGVTVTEDGVQGPGTLTSRVLDAGRTVTWDRLVHRASGGPVQLLVRTGSTPVPGPGWTDWAPEVSGRSRYAQYRAVLPAGATLHGTGITSDAQPLDTPDETGG
ncbi:DUF4082 domain-containing protein [Actinoplanes sp. RD1]|uniref:DUF4082 domain-containing protein n=1 Tax=Actinoplanes sp. RD1 TaxID=3064538 RepID=UPI00274202BE|nr:DUF4082 domain-containing protein [Actinoplanes sp. RD1]